MEVIVCAAGKGTRMGELCKDKPKHVLPVNGKPFLYHLLENLKKGGATKIILVGGYKFEKLKEYVEKIKEEFDIVLVNQFNEVGEDKYGTAMPLKAAQKYVQGEEFLVVYGDNLYSDKDIKELVSEGPGLNYVAALKHENPTKYGVFLHDENMMLKEVIEKPEVPPTNLINTGIYRFTKEIFTKIDELVPSLRGEFELTDAIQLLAKENKVRVKVLKDYWLDFGKPEDIPVVENFLIVQSKKRA